MKTQILFVSIAFASVCSGAEAMQPNSLSDAIFKQAQYQGATKASLTASDRQAIATLLPFRLLKDKVVDESCHQDVQPEVAVLDLNGDGLPEVIVSGGNDCSDGPTGSSIHVLAKFQTTWREILRVTAAEYRLPATHGTAGWRDLWILGRSECMGWWRFDGKTYQVIGSVDEQGKVCK